MHILTIYKDNTKKMIIKNSRQELIQKYEKQKNKILKNTILIYLHNWL